MSCDIISENQISPNYAFIEKLTTINSHEIISDTQYGYMNHTQKSTKNSNFGQSRDRQYNLRARGVRLHKASANVTNFGLPKSGGFVPASLIYEFDGFRNKMGKIYEGKTLHW